MASITDQNYLVWNQGKNPLVNFNFMLRVELLFDLPCKSVRAFTRELEYDFIQEGGLNDYVHMRRKPITKPFVLEVERYVGVDYIDPLPLGADLVLPVMLFVSRAHDQFIPGVVARTYVFTGCTVMKKTYGDLVADQSGLLVETTTIGYREMLCVDIPWSEVGDSIFGSTPTVPTQAVTEEKSAKELKELGQQLHDKALAAKEQADSEYSEQDAEDVIEELDTTLKQLSAAVEEGGVLVKRVESYEADLETCSDNVTKSQEAAAAARAAEEEERKAMLAAEEQWRPEENAYQQALSDAEALKEKKDRAQQELNELDTEEAKKALNEEKSQLEQELKALQDQEKTLQENKQQLEKKEEELQKLEQNQEPEDAQEEGQDTRQEDKDEKRRQLEGEIQTLRNQTMGQNYTGLITQTQRKLDGVEAELEELDQKREQMEQTLKDLESQYQQAQQLAREKEPDPEKKTAYEKALADWEAATEQTQKDEAAAEESVGKQSQAARELSQARQNLSRGKKQVSRLQNSLTNLKTWKDKGTAAQTTCESQYEQCQKYNDELQALPDEPLSDVNTKFEEVKKTYKEAAYQEKQVRQTQQYVEVGRSELELTREILPAQEQDTEAGGQTGENAGT